MGRYQPNRMYSEDAESIIRRFPSLEDMLRETAAGDEVAIAPNAADVFVSEAQIYEAYKSYSQRCPEFQAYFPHHRSTNDNREAIEALWTHGSLDADELRDLARRATLIIRLASRFFPHLQSIEESVGQFLGKATFGNAFFNYRDSECFPIHSDDYNVVACLHHICKKWRVFSRRQQKRLIWEGTTESHDVLFIPRGFPHAAQAIEASFHLAIAVN